jgi:glycosyltransferase involved in cell wall biosynthesis
MPEAVLDGETGLLTPPGDVAGVVGAVRALLDDPSTARQMGEKGRARMQRDFSIAAMVRGNLAIYERVVVEG